MDALTVTSVFFEELALEQPDMSRPATSASCRGVLDSRRRRTSDGTLLEGVAQG